MTWYDYGARFYDPVLGRWHAVDLMAEKYYEWSPFTYVGNNQVNCIDPDGREPVKKYVGTVSTFISVLNNTPSQLGQRKGASAMAGLAYLGATERKGLRPVPKATPYFNQKEGRYIYTKNGGWIDMTHFLFYAGKAYQNKLDGVKNPIGDAVQAGYIQEAFDPNYSKYSYEDLPSDKFGADFGVNFFNPESDQTFAEQLANYLNNELGATSPELAPNYNELPEDHYKNDPSSTNKTTEPKYKSTDEELIQRSNDKTSKNQY